MTRDSFPSWLALPEAAPANSFSVRFTARCPACGEDVTFESVGVTRGSQTAYLRTDVLCPCEESA